MDKLLEKQAIILKSVSTKLIRYTYHNILWDGRMIGLVGPRGVGKTTMMLQHIKLTLSVKDTLYVTADDLFFETHKLVELADWFVKNNGRHLIIDEIHKYPNWAQELKQVYDTYYNLQVIFTGSSVLDIYKGMADLSRRAAIYHMQGLSFREYLFLFHNITANTYTLEEILAHKVDEPLLEHPLPLFHDYLVRGYYPIGLEKDYNIKIPQVVQQTMETDIPIYANMNASTGKKLRQLMMIIAQSAPFKPVMQKLAGMIDVSRNQISDYLLYMEQAGMIAQLRNDVGGIRGLGKVEKIYIDNPTLVYALSSDNANIGNLRETFFFNQMRVHTDVISSKVADFQIGDKTFEVGGRNKHQKQIINVNDAYIVKDDIEQGYMNVVPLWQFGLTY